MIKHTPGPWASRNYPPWIDGGGRCLARLANHTPALSPAEIAANARLIAAAPDLLAALVGLLAESPNQTTAGDAARAAIARATDPETYHARHPDGNADEGSN